MTSKDVTPGKFYDAEGNEVAPTESPDVWICRRVEDYPPGWVEKRYEVIGTALCALCDMPIVYNPARKFDAVKTCMQCSGIEPLPIVEA